ncbi:ferrous iron transport protein A [Candidatus Calescamantes bacterium]|nr:ferrous iron transport protein A [Candidatus Calescamantes bacterium]
MVPLSLLPPGKEAVIIEIRGGMGWRRRLMELGLMEGMKIKVIQRLFPGPVVIAVGNARVVLGFGMAQRIMVREV